MQAPPRKNPARAQAGSDAIMSHMGGQLELDTPDRRTSWIGWVERRLSWLFWACAVILTPWVVLLFLTQAPRAEAHQIRPLAVGLILAMIAGILVTAWAYRRGSPLAVVAASFTAAAAFITAWFRALTQVGASHWSGSIPILLAVVAGVIGLCVFAIWSEFSAGAPDRWLPIVLALVALGLIPSLVVILTTAPAAQTAHHLRLAWTGLDVFEVAALAATALALQRRPAITAIPATVTGALLICDAWINIVPAHGAAFWEAIAMAFVELPLAALSFWVATRHPARPGGWARPGGDRTRPSGG
jgi:hypothetical protein